MSRFQIKISSNFEELWRYNITVVCEACDSEGNRVAFLSEESYVAPIGSNLSHPPVDYNADRTLLCKCNDGEYLNLLIYVIPHTLPTSNDLNRVHPFPLIVKVERDGKSILSQSFEINQWSGDNISLKTEN